MRAGDLTDKERFILGALMAGDMTVDEFVTPRGWYVNSWAPLFTKLRQRDLVRRTGEKRLTSHGAEAYVIQITRRGMDIIKSLGGSGPVAI